MIIERGLFLRELGPGKDAITCPFAAEHSEETSDTATVYFWPMHGGYKWGRIHCSHAHCAERKQDDYIRALGAESREVWRGQAGGSAPYYELPPVESYDDEAAQEDARRHTTGARPPTGGEVGDPDRPNGTSSYPAIPPLDALRIDPAEIYIARLTPQRL